MLDLHIEGSSAFMRGDVYRRSNTEQVTHSNQHSEAAEKLVADIERLLRDEGKMTAAKIAKSLGIKYTQAKSAIDSATNRVLIYEDDELFGLL